MTTSWYMFAIIFFSGLVTLIIRIVPFIMITRIQLSEKVVKWLSYISITLFTALVVDAMIKQPSHGLGFTINLSFVIITIPTIVVAFISRSLTITVVTGIVLMAGLRLFF